MKTIQMTLDEELVKQVDKIVKKQKTTRSAFTREALYRELNRVKMMNLEEKHKLGYERYPVTQKEFSVWEDEQDWGER